MYFFASDLPLENYTLRFFIKNFFSKCDQIRRKLWIWSHLLKKSLMENFIFCAVTVGQKKMCQINGNQNISVFQYYILIFNINTRYKIKFCNFLSTQQSSFTKKKFAKIILITKTNSENFSWNEPIAKINSAKNSFTNRFLP